MRNFLVAILMAVAVSGVFGLDYSAGVDYTFSFDEGYDNQVGVSFTVKNVYKSFGVKVGLKSNFQESAEYSLEGLEEGENNSYYDAKTNTSFLNPHDNGKNIVNTLKLSIVYTTKSFDFFGGVNYSLTLEQKLWMHDIGSSNDNPYVYASSHSGEDTTIGFNVGVTYNYSDFNVTLGYDNFPSGAVVGLGYNF